MNTFLEKLKKGMDIDEFPKKDVSQEEKPSAVLAGASQVKPETKPEQKKRALKKKTPKTKIEVENETKKSPAVAPEAAPKDKPQWFEAEGQLTVDVYQTDKDIVIRSAIAGIEPEDLDVTIENDKITIKGERKQQLEEKQKNYFYQECYWGRFSREIILPAEVDNSRAKAVLKNGILTIRIPKINREKQKKISVED